MQYVSNTYIIYHGCLNYNNNMTVRLFHCRQNYVNPLHSLYHSLINNNRIEFFDDGKLNAIPHFDEFASTLFSLYRGLYY